MEKREGKGSHQQSGHEPERPEQPGVFLLIVVSGVCEVACESSMRSLVALAASLNDFVPAESRIGICRGQDPVRAVAVVAFGCAGGAQPGDLAMKGIEEGHCLLLVTVSTLTHHLEAELRQIRADDAVGAVAGVAGGQLLFGVVVCGPMDAGLEDLADPEVAVGAGLLDVGRVDRGALIVWRQLAVGSVAVGAGGGDDQTALQESFAVDAVHIALHDVYDVGIDAQGRRLPGSMTLGAQHGYHLRESR